MQLAMKEPELKEMVLQWFACNRTILINITKYRYTTSCLIDNFADISISDTDIGIGSIEPHYQTTLYYNVADIAQICFSGVLQT